MERKFINDAVVADRQRTRYIDTLLPKYDASQDRYCADYFSKPFIRVQLKQKKFREFPVTTWRTRPFTPLLPKVHRKDLSELTYGVQKPRVIRESYNLAQYDRMLYQKPKRYGSVSDLESTYLGKSPRDSNARNNLRASESNLSRSKLGQAQSYSNVSRTRKPNVNKQSYRHLVKPTPPVEKLRQREKRFVNDAIRSEKLRTKYKDMIPPYDATDDRHTATGNIEPVDGST